MVVIAGNAFCRHVSYATMTAPARSLDRGGLRTLERGLALLEQVVAADGHATAKSLAENLGLTKSTCYQILKTLELTGYIAHVPGGSYAVGPGVAAMLRHLRNALVPEPRVINALHALRDETGDTAYACALRGSGIVLQAVAEGHGALVVRMLRPGMRDNVHARASCRAILSQLPEAERRRILPARRLPKVTEYTITTRSELRTVLSEARARGYAVEHQEFEEGVACLAAPYFDAAGSVAGALSVAMPAAKLALRESATAKTVKYFASQACHPAFQERP
jgi:DNA-binding IclR family transcriptional regulator